MAVKSYGLNPGDTVGSASYDATHSFDVSSYTEEIYVVWNDTYTTLKSEVIEGLTKIAQYIAGNEGTVVLPSTGVSPAGFRVGVDAGVNSVDYHNSGSTTIVSNVYPIAVEGDMIGGTSNALPAARIIADIERLKEVVTQSTHLA
jgi:hypothetical protein